MRTKILALVLALLCIVSLTACGTTNTGVIFLTEGNELALTSSMEENSPRIVLSEQVSRMENGAEDLYGLDSIVFYTDDGKYAYFMSDVEYGVGSLCQVNLKKLKPGSEENHQAIQEIDDDVLIWSLQKAGNGVAYCTYDDDEGAAYYYDGTERTRLLKSTYEEWQVLESGAGMYCSVYDDGNSNLYYMPFSAQGSAVKIAEECSSFSVHGDLVIYSRYRDDHWQVYSSNPQGEVQPLVTNASSLPGTVVDGKFYYTQTETEEKSLAFLLDENFTTDRLNEIPFPTEEDFYVDIYSSTVEELEALVNEEDSYDNWWDFIWADGGVFYNYEAKKNAYKYGEENQQRYRNYVNEYYGIDGHITDWDAYFEASEARSRLTEVYTELEKLGQETCLVERTDLYYYNGTEGVLISRDIDLYASMYADAAAQVVVYGKMRADEDVTKITPENLLEVQDPLEYYNSARRNEVGAWHCTTSAATDLAVNVPGGWAIGQLSGGKELLFRNYEQGNTYAVTISGGTAGEPRCILEGIYPENYQMTQDGTGLYFYSDLADGNGDLKIYQNETVTDVAKQVACPDYGMQVNRVYEDGVVLALREYDVEDGDGTLLLIENGETTRIADNVTCFQRISNHEILLVSDGNAYLYANGEKTFLSGDICYFWPMVSMEGSGL